MCPIVRFPELPENPNWKHNYSKHHHQYRGLSAPSSGTCSTNTLQETVPSFITNLFFRNPSATFTGTTLAKTSSMTREKWTSPKLYLSPSRYSTRSLSTFRWRDCSAHSSVFIQPHLSWGFNFFCLGPVHWEPAESGSQQTVGCSGWLLACFC